MRVKLNTLQKWAAGLLVAFVLFLNRNKLKSLVPASGSIQDADTLKIIRDELSKAGYNNQTIQNWQAVALHETGGLKSPVYKENLNPWGMKQPKIRPTNSIGENRGYALYASRTGAAQDIIKYMKHFKYPGGLDLSGHVDWMKSKGYFTAPLSVYKIGVQRWAARL